MRDETNLVAYEHSFNGEKVQAVNGRDLHRELGVTKDFSVWMKYQIDRLELVDGKDYLTYTDVSQVPHQGGTRSVQTTEYTLSLDAAANIAQASMTPRGNKIRQLCWDKTKDWYAGKSIATTSPAVALTKSDLARMVLESEAEKERLAEQNSKLLTIQQAQTKEIADLKPAAHLAKTLYLSSSDLNSQTVAKRLGMRSAQALHAELVRVRVIFNKNAQRADLSPEWYPFAQYADCGYCHVRPRPIHTNTRGVLTKHTLTWTEAGVAFIAKKLGLVDMGPELGEAAQ